MLLKLVLSGGVYLLMKYIPDDDDENDALHFALCLAVLSGHFDCTVYCESVSLPAKNSFISLTMFL